MCSLSIPKYFIDRLRILATVILQVLLLSLFCFKLNLSGVTCHSLTNILYLCHSIQMEVVSLNLLTSRLIFF